LNIEPSGGGGGSLFEGQVNGGLPEQRTSDVEMVTQKRGPLAMVVVFRKMVEGIQTMKFVTGRKDFVKVVTDYGIAIRGFVDGVK
jgi:hypothetical protein